MHDLNKNQKEKRINYCCKFCYFLDQIIMCDKKVNHLYTYNNILSSKKTACLKALMSKKQCCVFGNVIYFEIVPEKLQ